MQLCPALDTVVCACRPCSHLWYALPRPRESARSSLSPPGCQVVPCSMPWVCPDLSSVGYGCRRLLWALLVITRICNWSLSSPGGRQPWPIQGPQTSALTRLACGSPKRLRRGSRPVPRLRSRAIATGTATASILSLGALATGLCIERFGAEEAETETNLDLFQVTAIAPLGNGVAFSFGRFDVPFGIERHDAPSSSRPRPPRSFAMVVRSA